MLSAISTLTAHHWTFDGLVPDVPVSPQLRKLLNDLVGIIRMTPIGPPAVWVTAPSWRAFQLIAESHISLHGQGGRAWVDVSPARASRRAMSRRPCTARWVASGGRRG